MFLKLRLTCQFLFIITEILGNVVSFMHLFCISGHVTKDKDFEINLHNNQCLISQYRSNLLRLNILKVVQLTEKHLNKITSTDEFFKRISAVIHSNDPIARALTLRFVYYQVPTYL